MSPRHPSPGEKAAKKTTAKRGPSMDRNRHLEDARHHPLDNPLPHPPHKTLKKPALPKKHTPHTRAHEEALGPHTGKPGPISPPKRVSRTGTKTT
ncbi:MAG: hypothetical protein GYA23_10710 [Methanomicrobiales archaeon]|nr:hypothetical protein [Methanomicrobiales archaeon]